MAKRPKCIGADDEPPTCDRLADYEVVVALKGFTHHWFVCEECVVRYGLDGVKDDIWIGTEIKDNSVG